MSETVRIRFAGHSTEITARLGQSILEICEEHGIDLDHACGGVCACSTCHVKVVAGADALSEASEEEEDQLDEARGVELSSRLGCQARIVRQPHGGLIEVQIPAWNANLVQEGH
jgi:2Fe-2S ferredoxin